MPGPSCFSTLLADAGECYLMKDSSIELKKLFPWGSNLITEKCFSFSQKIDYILFVYFFLPSDISPLPLLGGKCKCISFLASGFHLPLVFLNQTAKLAVH